MTDDTIDEARLRKLMDEVSALPRSIEPPPDAWMNIRAAIEAGESAIGRGGAGANAGVESGSRHRGRMAFWQRPVFLAAAAVVLVASSSAVTAIAIGRRASDGSGVDTANRSRMAAIATDSNGPASLAQFTVVESDYLRAVNDLSATLESEQGSLSPETIAKLRESIKVIDTAILEARNALAADPANRTLIQMLANSYEQKVDLLKRTTEMARG
ncbi:MAG TPA: hypothetical protein VES88_00975 [Gemmatimonadaceae bacterium]|nr:hypothetical protein [Gemmatimonadaceae bacterium]